MCAIGTSLAAAVTGKVTRPTAKVGPCRQIDGRPVYAATDLVAYLACEHLTALERAAAGRARRSGRCATTPSSTSSASAGSSTRSASSPTSRPTAARRSTIEPDGSIEDRRRAAPRGRRGDHRGDGRRARTSSTRRRSSTAPGAATRTSCCASTSPDRPSRLGPVALRGRRHEARPPRQGERRPPDLLVHRPARADPGRPARVAARRPRRQRPDGRATPRRRLHGLLPQRPGPLPGDAWPTTTPPAYPAGRRRIPSRSTTATSAAGPPSASSAGAPTTTSASSPGSRRASAGRSRSAASRRSRPSAICQLPMRARRSRARRGRAGAGPRAGPAPARGPADRARSLRAAPARSPASRSTPNAGSRRCPQPSPATCSSTSRATRTRSTTASTTSSASLEIDGTFHAFWSRDDDGRVHPRCRAAGVRAAHGLLRGAAAPPTRTLHIYHYAPYEPTALKRLMGRYGTREDEVDDLLRGGVLVDLLRAVRQVAARIGRELLDQEDGGVLRVRRARSTCATRARASSPSSSGSSSARASGRQPTTSSGSSATTRTTSSATSGCATGWRPLRDELAALTGHDRAAAGAARRRGARRADRGAGASPGARRPPRPTRR